MTAPAEPAVPDEIVLDRGWNVASCPADAHDSVADVDGLDWLPATVPGTVAGALTVAGRWHPDRTPELDGRDWWYRTTFDDVAGRAGSPAVLRLDGLATIADVFLNGERVAHSTSMFVPVRVDVTHRLAPTNDLAIRFRALASVLQARRKPRARWRTGLVDDGALRWVRTALVGRTPGFSTGPRVVGPWRGVRVERPRSGVLATVRMRPALEDGTGVLRVEADLDPASAPTAGGEVLLSGPSGEWQTALAVHGGRLTGVVRVPDVAPWWPHTHGDPALHDVRVRLHPRADDEAASAPEPAELVPHRVGFRAIAAGPSAGHDVSREGLALHVNGVEVFARGSVWTGVDPVDHAPTPDALRRALEEARDAGMNLLRVAGIGLYEHDHFHGLCDELGIMVWQDLALASLDYPAADDAFRASLSAEVAALADRIGGRPSTAVVCGNSEVEQQAEMFGLAPGSGREPTFGTLVPSWLAAAGVDVPYVPSAPSGGVPAFRPDTGVAVYHGVGGYRRPVSDARRSGVRFAAECLAFANVPDDAALAAVGAPVGGGPRVHHPAWKAGVPRDPGAGWDFDDVRDHYLRTTYGVDPLELRAVDHERYVELSREVTGETMAATFGEWRRAASACGGGLVLWHRDVAPGAGWGVVDHTGAPKVAMHHLRRALAPVAVWLTDEGLNGLAVHVANDRPTPLRARLRVALYADGERPVAEGTAELDVPPRTTVERGVEAVIGRFVDSSWSYRFGPPAHDVVFAAIEHPGALGSVDLPGSLAVAFPPGRLGDRRLAEHLDVEAVFGVEADGPVVVVRSGCALRGLRIDVPGWIPLDDALSVEPHRPRTVPLRPDPSAPPPPSAEPPSSGGLRAINVRGRVPIRPQAP